MVRAASYGVLTGSAGRFGKALGDSWSFFITSATPRSSCGSRPARTDSGIVLHLDVGIDAVALDDPLARRATTEPNSGTKIWPPSISGTVAGDAHHAAPGALADQRAQTHLAEHVGEDVAVRARPLVDQADHASRRRPPADRGGDRRCVRP